MEVIKWSVLLTISALSFSIFIITAIEEYNQRACVSAFATSKHTVENIDKICK